MTIKWGDPIECNGVRPDWLRDDSQSVQWFSDANSVGLVTTAIALNWPGGRLGFPVTSIRLPADHPAYVALARGFHPWSGGESAPDDWDGGECLMRGGGVIPRSDPGEPYWDHGGQLGDIIGYRKRNARFDEPHLARIEVEGSAAVDGVFIKRMTEAEFAERFKGLVREPALSPAFKVVQALGLIESRAERFTRETGHAVTEAVEAALNWKDTQA